ncbi:MAG: hypothetical protein GWP91_01600 [Rhodobacterales bacterium]|nr:hypothetical protein [Rhodobacterales bacterium]
MLRLALLPMLLSGFWASDAMAVPLLQPLIEIVPVSDVIGDGTTQAHIHVLALFKDGEPIDGMVLKPSARQGRVTALDVAGPGLYHFGFIPPKVDKPQAVIIEVRGKTPDKRSVNISLTVMVQPADPSGLVGSSDRKEMVVGRDTRSLLTFTGGHLDGDVLLRNSAGELHDPVSLGGGVHKVRLQADERTDAHLNVVTAVSEGGLSSTVGYVVVPQLGLREQALSAEAGSVVTLQVGEREYGPSAADDQGQVVFNAALPPGVVEGQVTTIVDRVPTPLPLPIDNPDTQSLLLFPLPDHVPADAQLKIPVRAVVLDQMGAADGNTKPTFTATSGSFGESTHVGQGIYLAEYTPGEAGDISITATLGSELQSDTDDLVLLPKRDGTSLQSHVSTNPVAHVVVLPTASQMRSDGMSSLPITFATVDFYGQPVANAELQITVEAGGGQIPETATTDEHGLVDLHYTSGNEEALVHIRASAGDGVGFGAFVQSPGRVNWDAMPVSGQKAVVAIETTWRAARKAAGNGEVDAQ